MGKNIQRNFRIICSKMKMRSIVVEHSDITYYLFLNFPCFLPFFPEYLGVLRSITPFCFHSSEDICSNSCCKTTVVTEKQSTYSSKAMRYVRDCLWSMGLLVHSVNTELQSVTTMNGSWDFITVQ